MKIRSGFVSNSSSTSFVIDYDYDKLYEYRINQEIADTIFKDSFPDSLKYTLLSIVREHSERIDDNKIEVYIDCDEYVYTDLNKVLCNYPHEYLNMDKILDMRVHV